MSKGAKKAVSEITPIVQDLLRRLECKHIVAQVCGSIRRAKTLVGDVDIVCRSDTGDAIVMSEVAASIPGFTLTRGGPVNAFGVFQGLDINLFAIPKKSWGAGLLHATGPWQFNVRCRSIAKSKGWLLNQYGLYDGMKLLSTGEKEILKLLGLGWVPPEKRDADVKREDAVVRWFIGSNGNARYQTVVNAQTDAASCGCPGFKYHGHCKHIDAVRAELRNSVGSA
jgi:DNA polymerase/3'-5' exonuclease PolX